MNDQSSIQDLKKRIHELEKKADLKNRLARTLFDISYAVNTTTDLIELYRSIYDALNELMTLPNFYIALYNRKEKTIHFPFWIDEADDALFEDRYFIDSNSLTSEVIIKKEPLFLNETALKEKAHQNKVFGSLPKTWIGTPLMIRQNVIGVVAIQHYTDPDYFTQEDVDILVTVSHHIALAIERKQSLDERDLLENYLCNIINSMPSILIGIDHKLQVTHWNSQAELETGLNAGLAVGKKLFTVFPRLSDIMDKVKFSIRSNKIKTLLKKQTKVGANLRYEDIIIYPIPADNADGAVIRIDDITEHVRLEEIMIQSEKMMSIGGLAAGMAHEINNPLAGMMQNAQVIYNRLTNDLPANTETAERLGISMDVVKAYMAERGILKKLEAINDTGNRAARIVSNMLSFARKSDTLKTRTDLSELLMETIDLARSDYNLKKQYDFKKIRIETDFEKKLPRVLCDRSKIQQVFLNIFKNGAHAMFSDKNESPCFYLKTFNEDRFVCAHIRDNGPGVDDSAKKRLFEPFYTTKAIGDGTGLGLSVSYFIIANDHKGELMVESSPGKGTTFIIKLPI